MESGKLVFAQLMDFVPRHDFDVCVRRYGGDRRPRGFSCRDQFLCLAFAQLTFRESLRDIETCLRAVEPKLYHAGFRGKIARSTLADANRTHDWRIFADFAQVLIGRARKLYAEEPFGVDLEQTVYALDSTTIDLCLSLFPWAQFRRRKGAVKLHTLLDLRGNIPCFVRISHGKTHDVTVLDHLTIVLAGRKSSRLYPDPLRRIAFYDAENDRRFVFLTNNFTLPALTIARLYKCRWQIELFFKWIKQHLRIKAFYGTSDNAVKIQVWIAISVYVLVAIVRKELGIDRSLNEILQILSVTIFEKTPIFQALSEQKTQESDHGQRN